MLPWCVILGAERQHHHFVSTLLSFCSLSLVLDFIGIANAQKRCNCMYVNVFFFFLVDIFTGVCFRNICWHPWFLNYHSTKNHTCKHAYTPFILIAMHLEVMETKKSPVLMEHTMCFSRKLTMCVCLCVRGKDWAKEKLLLCVQPCSQHVLRAKGWCMSTKLKMEPLSTWWPWSNLNHTLKLKVQKTLAWPATIKDARSLPDQTAHFESWHLNKQ